KYIVGYKEEKDRKKAAKLRGNRPPSWDETVERISEMVLTKEGEQVIESLQKFQCLRCQRLTTLMPGQLEEDIFTPDYKCPQCKSTRDMVEEEEGGREGGRDGWRKAWCLVPKRRNSSSSSSSSSSSRIEKREGEEGGGGRK
ncbi:hypothetical protein VYU27_008405, partial [Nannochloropsis oceanica]